MNIQRNKSIEIRLDLKSIYDNPIKWAKMSTNVHIIMCNNRVCVVFGSVDLLSCSCYNSLDPATEIFVLTMYCLLSLNLLVSQHIYILSPTDFIVL